MDFESIREAIKVRMRELGLSNNALAQQAKVDRSLVAKFLSGEPWSMRPSTLGKVEKALGWHAGAIEEIGQGVELATRSADARDGERLDAIEERLASIQELLAQLVADPRARR